MKLRIGCIVVGFLSLSLFVFAQTPSGSNPPTSLSSAQVPRLIRFSGLAKDATGKSLTGVVGITFSLYKDQQGGAPLWTETQNVQPDSSGHYTVLLGSTKTMGVPAEMFVSGEAQWLGVQPQGEGEQARVLIVSVPYALKALDAETVGGKPASAFMAAPNFTSSGSGGAAVASTGAAPNGAPTLSGGGTKDYIPLWLSSTKLGSSKLYQSTTGNVGIGTKTPAAMLDVNGTINSLTSFNLGGNIFALGSYANANAFLGFAGNSTMTGVENNAIGEGSLLANTTGDSNTAVGYSLPKNTAGSWNAGIGVNTLLNNTIGNFNSALGSFAGQTLDGSNVTGSNDTGVGAGAAFGTGSVTNATAIGSNSVVNESNALVLGSIKGLNGATSNVNVGIGTEAPAAMLDVVGTINTATSFNLGGNPFAFGSLSNTNAFLGFAGNSTMTGMSNTAIGAHALSSNTKGYRNAASGGNALLSNTTGWGNTAVGIFALSTNTGGSDNTALGYGAGPDQNSPNLSNATAIGAFATVSENGALVLGGTGQYAVNVGIGTATPAATLDVRGGTDNATNAISVITASNAASAVFATNTATSGSANGGYFQTYSSAGVAVVGINQGSGGAAGYFQGNVTITGNLSKGSGSFKIDHPLDPANKYLYHSFVESPDMMNIYNGLASLDARGSVWIMLPEYFEALNQDFRYQLTSVGKPQPRLYVAKEILGNRFKIAGGEPGGKVSWQVTGIRHDAYAVAHRIQVEVEKPPQEQGHYLHPELFGASEELLVGYRIPLSTTMAGAQSDSEAAGTSK